MRITADPSQNVERDELEKNGFAIYPGLFRPPKLVQLDAALGPISGPGRRNLLDVPAVADLARSRRVLDVIQPRLKADPRPVRAIYFNKSSESNWMVPWHQ